MSMTFEQWKRRPVYVAQCHTWALAAKLDVCCVRFRCLPAYRDAEARVARRIVAEAVRAERAERRGQAKPTSAGSGLTWFWSFAGPRVTYGGAVVRHDLRRAALSVLTAGNYGEIFAEMNNIPPVFLADIPSAPEPKFELKGDWGRLTICTAPSGQAKPGDEMYAAKTRGMYVLRQERFRQQLHDTGVEHPHDVCAVARSVQELYDMVNPHWQNVDFSAVAADLKELPQ